MLSKVATENHTIHITPGSTDNRHNNLIIYLLTKNAKRSLHGAFMLADKIFYILERNLVYFTRMQIIKNK